MKISQKMCNNVATENDKIISEFLDIGKGLGDFVGSQKLFYIDF